MPDKGNIEQFDNPINGLEPNQRGAEAFAMEGRRVGMFYHQIGQDLGADIKNLGDALVEHQTNAELGHGAKTATDMELQLEVGRAQFFHDNQGPDAAAKWQQHVQEVTTQWQDSFQTERGRLWAADRGSEIYRSAVQKGIGDQVEIDMASNLQNRFGARANLVAMSGLDPASSDRVMQQIASTDATFQPALMDAGEWAKNHAEFVHEGQVQVAIQHYLGSAMIAEQQFTSGSTTSAAYDQATRELAAGKYADLLGPEVDTLRQRLEEAKTRGQEAFTRNQDQAVKASVLQGDNDFLSIYHDYNELRNHGQPLPADAQQRIRQYETDHPHNTTQSMELERFLTQDTRDQIHQTFVHSDGDTLSDFGQRVGLPSGDPKALQPTQVAEAVRTGKLNSVQGNQFLREIAEARKGAGGAGGAGQWRSRLMQWVSVNFRSQLIRSATADPSGLGLGGSGADPAGSMAYGEAVRRALDYFQGYMEAEHMSPQKAFDTMTTAGPRSFANLLPYLMAAKSSGQPEDFFSINQNPDQWINQHGGWRWAEGQPAGGPGAPAAPAGGGGAPTARLPGETLEAWKARTGG